MDGRRHAHEDEAVRSWQIMRLPASIHHVGASWVGGFAVGGLAGWAVLGLTFPSVLAAAVLAVWYPIASRARAGLGGLLVGLGITSSWALATSSLICDQSSPRVCTELLPNAPARLADPDTWPSQALLWLVVSVVLVVGGAIATFVAPRRRQVGGTAPRPFPSGGVIVIAAVAVGIVAWSGLPLRPGEYAIATGSWPAWFPGACGGFGLDTVVRGDPTDPRVVWLENRMDAPGQVFPPRFETVWPAGYRARFTPTLEVVDGGGDVVLRDGDPVMGSCGLRGGNPQEEVMVPPFR
jgi:hypothetical protein